MSESHTKQTRRGLDWGEPELAPLHPGQHDPVSLKGEVRCAMCGARAKNGEPEQWPDADMERWREEDHD